jgi:hypothetical protein
MLREEIVPDSDNPLEKIMDTKIAELRTERNATSTSRSMNSRIDALAPKLMTGSIPAYEPDWKRLNLHDLPLVNSNNRLL